MMGMYGYLGLLLLVYVLLRGLYNVFLHPLRDIPGPLRCRFSSFSRHLATVRGEHVHLLSALHRQYGPVVRFAPGEISYITSQSWKDIYGHRRADTFVKDKSFFGAKPYNIDPMTIIQDPDHHARVRQAFSPAFSDRAAREQEPVLLKYADQMVWRMGENAKTSGSASQVDLVNMFQFATFDAITDLAFGEPLHLLERGEYHPWVKVILDNLKFAAWSGAMRKVLGSPLDAWVASTLLAPLKKKSYAHFNFAADMVNKRLKTETKRPDIWSFVLRQADETGEGLLSLKEMHANASTIIIAGSETSATCLSALSWFILQDEKAYAQLIDEVRTSFQSDEDITLAELAKLPYLNACISESLRIFPPAPGGMPRFVPKGGEVVNGRWIPGGTTVYSTTYAAAHHPSNFHDPDSFRPERWLSRDKDFANDNRDASQPFSIGPRNCIGRTLAWHEMRLLVAKAFWHYDMELCDETEDFLDVKVFLAWQKKPLIVKLTPVER